jgi:hypothetical protein
VNVAQFLQRSRDDRAAQSQTANEEPEIIADGNNHSKGTLDYPEPIRMVAKPNPLSMAGQYHVKPLSQQRLRAGTVILPVLLHLTTA